MFSCNASIFKLGYDGKYLDLNLALGPAQEFITIDFVAIWNDLKELFN